MTLAAVAKFYHQPFSELMALTAWQINELIDRMIKADKEAKRHADEAERRARAGAGRRR